MAELHKRFGARMAIATSGQPTDTAIVALAVKAGVKKPRVYTTYTYRLFPETYTYFDELEKILRLFKIERFLPPEKKNLRKWWISTASFYFLISKDKQEYCCYVRKVLPNQKALGITMDVWVTGLRHRPIRIALGAARAWKLLNMPHTPSPLSPKGRGWPKAG